MVSLIDTKSAYNKNQKKFLTVSFPIDMRTDAKNQLESHLSCLIVSPPPFTFYFTISLFQIIDIHQYFKKPQYLTLFAIRNTQFSSLFFLNMNTSHMF